jgi:hypothetical protein
VMHGSKLPLTAWFTEVIFKPFTYSDLATRIRRVLDD